jgi:hypothetical protein
MVTQSVGPLRHLIDTVRVCFELWRATGYSITVIPWAVIAAYRIYFYALRIERKRTGSKVEVRVVYKESEDER